MDRFEKIHRAAAHEQRKEDALTRLREAAMRYGKSRELNQAYAIISKTQLQLINAAQAHYDAETTEDETE